MHKPKHFLPVQHFSHYNKIIKHLSLYKRLILLLLLLLLIVQRPPEQHDVWLRAVNRIMDPPSALLNSNRSPLILPKKKSTGLTSTLNQTDARWLQNAMQKTNDGNRYHLIKRMGNKKYFNSRLGIDSIFPKAIAACPRYYDERMDCNANCCCGCSSDKVEAKVAGGRVC